MPTHLGMSPLQTSNFEGLSWEDLSKQTKQLENQLDTDLLSLGRLISSALRRRFDHRPALESLRQAEVLSQEVEEKLDRLGGMIELLAERAGEAMTNLHVIQRHREIHAEYSKELRKTREHLVTAKETAELYTATAANSPSQNYTAKSPATDQNTSNYLMMENGRMESARNQTDHIINIAYSAQSNLHNQRISLLESNRRMAGLADKFPLIDQLLGRIRFRRNRDKIIIVGLIVGLTLFSLYFMFHK